MVQIGTIQSGKVIDENERTYFIQIDGVTFGLSKHEINKPLKLGSTFKGFIYENDKHRMKITRNTPEIGIERYGWGTVVGSKFDLGVFVDIGLPDKDIAVSMDVLPSMNSLWPNTGDKLMIALETDKKNRIWGKLADKEIFHAISQPVTSSKMKNTNISLTVTNPKLKGTEVISDHYNLGFIDKSEQDEEPRLGQQLTGRVIGIRPNKTLYLSIRPRGYEVMDENAEMIKKILENTVGNKLNFTDKSSPEEIKNFFGISKAQFKRAIGRLLKTNVIRINSDNIELIKKEL